MFPIKQTITRKGTGYDAKTWREFLKEAWEETAKYWHQYILPKHFTRAAIGEYSYDPRTAAHEKLKARKYGHRRPLVFTGELERQATRIRATSSTARGGKIKLHTPWYVSQFRKALNHPDMGAELRAISQADAEALAKVIDEFMARRIKQENQTVNISAGHRV